MAEFALGIGTIVMVLGGVLLGGSIICFLGILLSCAWIAFSESFRAICKAESLIHDYRKNREKFLEWREGEKT